MSSGAGTLPADVGAATSARSEDMEPVDLSVRRHRVLVVGAGVAALSAALALGEATVLVDTVLGGGSSPWAQGGMAAALAADDSTAAHAEDTVAVSGGIGDRLAAERITNEAPEVVAWLGSLGARFDTDAAGTLCLGREAGHRTRRIVHACGDATGAEIMRTLVAAVRATATITVHEQVTVLDLVRDVADEHVVGVLARDQEGALTLHLAGAVVLGTGGYGHLFAATTNPAQVAGAAVAMAARAGIALADLEMVQFHPTALAAPGRDPLPLLTEALRGEGAILVNDLGQRFMVGRHPDAELAPRDVVARAIYAQMVAGRTPYLDARAAVGEHFPARFPTVFALAMAEGIDPRTDLLPVSPAAHYCMGGVATDVAGRASKPGLWVVGEAASSGVHGANRLASNSLLEGIVMGRAVAAEVVGWIRTCRERTEPDHVVVPTTSLTVGQPDAGIYAKLRALLWRHAGVVRDHQDLCEGLAALDRFAAAEAGAQGLAARNAVTVARLVLGAALARTESRGAHFRADHPRMDPLQARRQVARSEPEPTTRLEVTAGLARVTPVAASVAA